SLKQSSIHWFVTISCKMVTRGLPSSLSQLQTLPPAMFSQHTLSSVIPVRLRCSHNQIKPQALRSRFHFACFVHQHPGTKEIFIVFFLFREDA
ncbi:MAG: hypothetical protein LIR40_01575, partial [Bacteroidota bacterium]|nr:hypothetical protein [Bacteroidota bacterium]